MEIIQQKKKNRRQVLGLHATSDDTDNSDMETSTPLRVGIVGAGAIALASAALLHQAGHVPMLWAPRGKATTHDDNNDDDDITTTTTTTITVTGKLEDIFTAQTVTSAAALVQHNDIIMLCLPANGHRTVMEACAPYLRPEQNIIIQSHASFGSLYLAQLIQKQQQQSAQTDDNNNANTLLPIIHAWGTTVATARRTAPGVVRINTIRASIDTCIIPYSTKTISNHDNLGRYLFPQITNFVPRDGLLAIALSNLNPQNHLGIALGNMSRMERGEEWYQSLHITPTIGRLLQDLDAERLAIAEACGVQVKTIFEHFSWSFHVPIVPNNISEMNQDIHRRGNDVLGPNTADSRYILEDVPFGLVPTIVLGRLVGRPALLHEAGVLMMSSMYGRDFNQENDLLPVLDCLQDLEQLRKAGETGIVSSSSRPSSSSTSNNNKEERSTAETGAPTRRHSAKEVATD